MINSNYASEKLLPMMENEYKVGLGYLHGIGVVKDLERALIHIKNSANNGNFMAQLSLAFIYFDETYAIQNKTSAYIQFKIIADYEEHPRALLMLGMMNEYGEGTNQNTEKAIKYYKKSSKQGNDDAKNKLEMLK